MTSNQEHIVRLAKDIVAKNPATTLSENEWALLLLAANDPYSPITLKEISPSIDVAIKTLDNFSKRKGYFGSTKTVKLN